MHRPVSDPRAPAIRDGYATIAHAYDAHLQGELAGKPLDRGFLDAFAAETRDRGRVVDLGAGPDRSRRTCTRAAWTSRGSTCRPR